jgi:hypothetical protein
MKLFTDSKNLVVNLFKGSKAAIVSLETQKVASDPETMAKAAYGGYFLHLMTAWTMKKVHQWQRRE